MATTVELRPAVVTLLMVRTTRSRHAATLHQRWPVLLALVASAVPAALVASRSLWRATDGSWRVSLFDDAMISMSYARTFAGGDGLVWYPGAPRVEGITNPAWTMLMALLHRLGLPPTLVGVAILAVGVALVWGSALLALRWGRTFGVAGPGPSFGLVLVVAAHFPLVFWAVRGMEVGLITFLAMVVVVAADRLDGGWSRAAAAALTVAVVLGCLTRTEFALVPGVAALWSMVGRSGSARRVGVPAVAAAAATLVATTTLRLWYYGRPFPNTYYLKVEGVELWERLLRGVAVDLVVAPAYLVPPVLVVAAGWHVLGRSQRRSAALVLAVAGTQVAYGTWVGGDAWEGFLFPNRYLTPATTLLTMLAVCVAVAARHEAGAWSARVLVVTGTGPMLTVTVSRVIAHVLDRPDLASWQGLGLLVPAFVVLLAGLGAVAWTSSQPTRRARVFPVVLAALLVLGAGFRITQLQLDDGNRFSVLGDQLGLVTRPGAVIAVNGAGGTQYWSDRPAVDLLGKSDRRIAEGPPKRERFIPGHDKFDHEYSVGELRPDVVAQGVDPEYLLEQGYVPVTLRDGDLADAIRHEGRMVLFVRDDSSRIRWSQLVPVG